MYLIGCAESTPHPRATPQLTLPIARPTLPSVEQWHSEIAKLRRARGWTQEQLAVYAGLARTTVARLERSEYLFRSAQLSTLERVANALGCALSDLHRSMTTPRREIP